MDFANADKAVNITDKVQEPKMKQLLKKIIKQTGKSTESHTKKDSSIVKVDYDVKKVGDSYQVHLLAKHKGEIINEQNFIVTPNADGSINMINEKEGINVDFYGSETSSLTDSMNDGLTISSTGIAETLGSGSSDWNGARIDLYDSGNRSGSSTLILIDSYSGCGGANAGDFNAEVYTTDTTTVTYNTNGAYWHWCISGHDYEGGKITHEGNTKYLTSSDESGAWLTTNTGTNPYS